MTRMASATLPDSSASGQGSSTARAGEIGFPAKPEEGKPTLTALLRTAVEACHAQQKEAAIAQGYGTVYWARIATGEKKAHLDPVASLPEDIQCAFVMAWAERLGLTCFRDDPRLAAFDALVTAAQRCQRLIQAELVLPSKPRAAKADLR